MLLRIKLDADLADQLLLRLEKIDVLFLVLQQVVEKFLRHIIADGETIIGGLGIKPVRVTLGRRDRRR